MPVGLLMQVARTEREKGAARKQAQQTADLMLDSLYRRFEAQDDHHITEQQA